MPHSDVVVIGAGVIGCSIARRLRVEGLSVTLLDSGAPGDEASSAAAGMLSPSAEAEPHSPLFPLARASLNLYPSLAEQLISETAIDPQYRTEGTLLPFQDAAERESWLQSLQWQSEMGVPSVELPASEVSHQEPLLRCALGAFFLPEDHQVDNRRLMQSLVDSCRRRGVRFLLGRKAREIVHDGKHVSGVLLDDRFLAASAVVNCAGAWASEIQVKGLPRAPIRPVKGQMAALQSNGKTLRHVVRSDAVYLVPRTDGRILVGSTMEEAGFDKTPRAGAVVKLLSSAQQLCPALQDAKIVEVWAGLRPASPDGLPLLGETAVGGYWVALGHFRNGILLAPITAEVISSGILGRRFSEELRMEPFSPGRFGM